MISLVSGATVRGEVYDYNGFDLRTKVNYSLFDAENFSGTRADFAGGNITIKPSSGIGGWFNGLFNWTVITDYLSFDGSNLDFTESLLNATILDLVADLGGGDFSFTDFDLSFKLNFTDSFNENFSSQSQFLNDSYANKTYAYNQTYSGDGFYILENGTGYYLSESQLNSTIDDKLNSSYHNVTSAWVIKGTIDEGELGNIQHPDGDYDGITLDFSEEAGSPGLEVYMNFTDVADFYRGIMRYKTSSISGDYPTIQMWDYETNEWEDYPPMAEIKTFATIAQPVFDSQSHLEDGVAQMRIYKESNGNTNNHYYIDWVAIVEGPGMPGGQETDPHSYHRNKNVNINDYNLTATWVNVSSTLYINGINISKYAFNQSDLDFNFNQSDLGWFSDSFVVNFTDSFKLNFTEAFNENLSVAITPMLADNFNRTDFDDAFTQNLSVLTFSGFNFTDFQDSFNLNMSELSFGNFNDTDFQQAFWDNFTISYVHNFSTQSGLLNDTYANISDFQNWTGNGTALWTRSGISQVGIGTDSPSVALNVSGSVGITTDLGVGSDLIIGDDLVVRDTATIQGASLTVGKSDTQTGLLSLYGHTTGSNEGGELRFYNAEDYDSSPYADYTFMDSYKGYIRWYIGDDWRNQMSFKYNLNTFNDGGNDVDFRVEGLNDGNLFYVNAGTDKVGIGTNAPSHDLTINGNINLSGSIYLGSDNNYMEWNPTYNAIIRKTGGNVADVLGDSDGSYGLAIIKANTNVATFLTSGGDINATGNIMGNNYYSGDATKGLEYFSGVPSGGVTVKDGLITAASATPSSFKSNINNVETNFSKIFDLDLKSYEYTQDAISAGKGMKGNYMGYMLEDIVALGYDELITYDSEGKPYSYNPYYLTYYLIEIVKEQQERIDNLEKLETEAKAGSQSYYCQDKDEYQECPFGISGGIGTRCYKTEELNSWFYCSTGWKNA